MSSELDQKRFEVVFRYNASPLIVRGDLLCATETGYHIMSVNGQAVAAFPFETIQHIVNVNNIVEEEE